MGGGACTTQQTLHPNSPTPVLDRASELVYGLPTHARYTPCTHSHRVSIGVPSSQQTDLMDSFERLTGGRASAGFGAVLALSEVVDELQYAWWLRQAHSSFSQVGRCPKVRLGPCRPLPGSPSSGFASLRRCGVQQRARA